MLHSCPLNQIQDIECLNGWMDGWILTQLDVADPDALFTFLQDLLKVNTSEATGAAGHQDGYHAHKLGTCRGGLLGRRRRVRGPLQRAEKIFDYANH